MRRDQTWSIAAAAIGAGRRRTKRGPQAEAKLTRRGNPKRKRNRVTLSRRVRRKHRRARR